MKLTKSDLQKLTCGRETGDRTGCPTPEQLAACADGAPSSPLTAHVTAHVAGCSACSSELRVALALRSEWPLETRSVDAPVPFPPARRSYARVAWVSALGTAACVVIALLGRSALDRFSRDPVPAPVLRGAEGIFGDPAPADRTVLDAAPARLSLQIDRTRIDPQATFSVALFDAEATRLWESAAEPAPDFALPDSARSVLRPGVAYGWRVFVRDRVETWQSPLYRFEFRP